MTSPAIRRNPHNDPTLTPENAALVVIDSQPIQFGSIVTLNRRALIANGVAVARLARLFERPVVLSTASRKSRLPSSSTMPEPRWWGSSSQRDGALPLT